MTSGSFQTQLQFLYVELYLISLLILSVEMIFYFDGFANGQIDKIS